MAVFPDITPSYSYEEEKEFSLITLGPSETGLVQRRRRSTTSYSRFLCRWQHLTEAQETQLYNFFVARYGGWEAFAFFDFAKKVWTSIACGSGTGTELNFDSGAKETGSSSDVTRKVYVGGVEKTEGVHYNWSSGAGTNGQDRIAFTGGNAPGAGVAVTTDYYGRRYYATCVVKEPAISRENWKTTLYRTGLTILEVTA